MNKEIGGIIKNIIDISVKREEVLKELINEKDKEIALLKKENENLKNQMEEYYK